MCITVYVLNNGSVGIVDINKLMPNPQVPTHSLF